MEKFLTTFELDVWNFATAADEDSIIAAFYELYLAFWRETVVCFP